MLSQRIVESVSAGYVPPISYMYTVVSIKYFHLPRGTCPYSFVVSHLDSRLVSPWYRFLRPSVLRLVVVECLTVD